MGRKAFGWACFGWACYWDLALVPDVTMQEEP